MAQLNFRPITQQIYSNFHMGLSAPEATNLQSFGAGFAQVNLPVNIVHGLQSPAHTNRKPITPERLNQFQEQVEIFGFDPTTVADLADVETEGEAEAILASASRELRQQRLFADNPVAGFSGTLVGVLADPTIAVPGAVAFKGGRIVYNFTQVAKQLGVGKTALSGAAIGAAFSGAHEASLAGLRQDVELDDVPLAIGAGALLGGAITAPLAHLARRGAVRNKDVLPKREQGTAEAEGNDKVIDLIEQKKQETIETAEGDATFIAGIYKNTRRNTLNVKGSAVVRKAVTGRQQGVKLSSDETINLRYQGNNKNSKSGDLELPITAQDKKLFGKPTQKEVVEKGDAPPVDDRPTEYLFDREELTTPVHIDNVTYAANKLAKKPLEKKQASIDKTSAQLYQHLLRLEDIEKHLLPNTTDELNEIYKPIHAAKSKVGKALAKRGTSPARQQKLADENIDRPYRTLVYSGTGKGLETKDLRGLAFEEAEEGYTPVTIDGKEVGRIVSIVDDAPTPKPTDKRLGAVAISKKLNKEEIAFHQRALSDLKKDLPEDDTTNFADFEKYIDDLENGRTSNITRKDLPILKKIESEVTHIDDVSFVEALAGKVIRDIEESPFYNGKQVPPEWRVFHKEVLDRLEKIKEGGAPVPTPAPKSGAKFGYKTDDTLTEYLGKELTKSRLAPLKKEVKDLIAEQDRQRGGYEPPEPVVRTETPKPKVTIKKGFSTKGAPIKFSDFDFETTSDLIALRDKLIEHGGSQKLIDALNGYINQFEEVLDPTEKLNIAASAVEKLLFLKGFKNLFNNKHLTSAGKFGKLLTTDGVFRGNTTHASVDEAISQTESASIVRFRTQLQAIRKDKQLKKGRKAEERYGSAVFFKVSDEPVPNWDSFNKVEQKYIDEFTELWQTEMTKFGVDLEAQGLLPSGASKGSAMYYPHHFSPDKVLADAEGFRFVMRGKYTELIVGHIDKHLSDMIRVRDLPDTTGGTAAEITAYKMAALKKRLGSLNELLEDFGLKTITSEAKHVARFVTDIETATIKLATDGSITKLAKDAASELFDRVTGISRNGSTANLLSNTTNLRARELNLTAAEAIPYIETHLSETYVTYLHRVVPELELVRQLRKTFGSKPTNQELISGAYPLKLLKEERSKLIDEALARGEKTDILEAELAKELKTAEDVLTAIVERLRHKRGQPPDPNTKPAQILTWWLSTGLLADLAGITITSVPDIAQTITAAGLVRFLRLPFEQLIGDSGRMFKTIEEAQAFGLAAHTLTDEVTSGSGRITGAYRDQVRNEALNVLLKNFGKVTLFSRWNSRMKFIATNAIGLRIFDNIRIADDVNATVGGKERATNFLRQQGITEDLQRRLTKQLNKPGASTDSGLGTKIPDLRKWDDDPELRDEFILKLHGLSERTIITPNAASPNFVDDSPYKRAIFMFTSFLIASHQMILTKGVNKPSAAFFAAVGASAALGIMVSRAKAEFNGEEAIKRWEDKSLVDHLTEGLSRGGQLGLVPHLGDIASKLVPSALTDYVGLDGVDNAHFAGRDLLSSTLGVSIGRITDIYGITQADDLDDVFRGLGRVVPYASFPAVQLLERLATED